MASLFSHPAGVLALNYGMKNRPSRRLLWLSVLLTLLPDADVIAFRFGVAYSSPWGHRGFTHSIVFALIIGVCCLPFSRLLTAQRLETFLWTSGAALSHALFDALTNGGLGVALLWPFSNERYFFPLRPVTVSPIGVWSFFSLRGILVLISEFFFLWLPFLGLSFLVRKQRERKALRD